MSTLRSPTELIELLQGIHSRSRQHASELPQQEEHREEWTAIGFRVANNYCLTHLDETREIFPYPHQITHVPKTSAWICGIANLRGDLLPIIDLKYFLNGQQSKITKSSRVIVMNQADFYCGLLIDEVLGLKHFQAEPENVSSATNNNLLPYLTGTLFQSNIHWNIFSFNTLAEDERFLNAAA